jgi:hypothetical protein
VIQCARELAAPRQFCAAIGAVVYVSPQCRGRLAGVAVEEIFEFVWK